MAWIESHQSNRDHPKIIRAARALGISKITMLGHMHLLWYWALDYAQDGNLSAFEPVDIAEAAEWDGDAAAFVSALAESAKIGGKPGLLEYLDGALVIHDWYDYAGKLIDRRREDADRKRASRNADVRKTSAGHPVDDSTPSFVPYPTVPYPTEPNQKEEEMIPISADVDHRPPHSALQRKREQNAQMPPKLRRELADAVLELTGLLKLANSTGPGAQQALDTAHETAITLYGMGYTTPQTISGLAEKWRGSWQVDKNPTARPTWKQVLELASKPGDTGNGDTPKAFTVMYPDGTSKQVGHE